MRKPDFIVVGAMRAGTTALAAALNQHPDIAISEPKEPNYFATLHGALEYSGPGDQWFAGQNSSEWESYLSLFQGDSALVGEASAMYLALPETAADVRRLLPDAKIVIVLRDPAARARSAHSYLRSKGRETLGSFIDGLEAEATRKSDGFGPMWWYEEASDYEAGLRAYLEAFGRESVLVITNEELKSDPGRVVSEVLEFLGARIDESVVNLLKNEAVNSGGEPRSALLTRALYPPDRLRSAVRKLSPEFVRRGVAKARAASTSGTPAIESVPADVEARFRDSALRTQKVLERDLSAVWRSLRGASND